MKGIYKWGAAALVAGGGVAAWLSMGENAQQDFRFKTDKVTKGDFVSKVQATGTLDRKSVV